MFFPFKKPTVLPEPFLKLTKIPVINFICFQMKYSKHQKQNFRENNLLETSKTNNFELSDIFWQKMDPTSGHTPSLFKNC